MKLSCEKKGKFRNTFAKVSRVGDEKLPCLLAACGGVHLCKRVSVTDATVFFAILDVAEVFFSSP